MAARVRIVGEMRAVQRRRRRAARLNVPPKVGEAIAAQAMHLMQERDGGLQLLFALSRPVARARGGGVGRRWQLRQQARPQLLLVVLLHSVARGRPARRGRLGGGEGAGDELPLVVGHATADAMRRRRAKRRKQRLLARHRPQFELRRLARAAVVRAVVGVVDIGGGAGAGAGGAGARAGRCWWEPRQQRCLTCPPSEEPRQQQRCLT